MTDEQRKRIHDFTYSCDDRAELAECIVTLEDENAKLRELIRKALGSGHIDRSCAECGIREECHARDDDLPFYGCLFEERIEEEMHELGIEV